MKMISAGWIIPKICLLITERKTRCIIGLGLKGKLGIFTPQRTAPRPKLRFVLVQCEDEEPRGYLEELAGKFKSSSIAKEYQKIFHYIQINFPVCLDQ